MQFFRRIVFYIFVTVYVIVCPLLLLYAYGYIYKPGSEEVMMATGVIYVATAPIGSEIYVDDKKYASNTPAAIMELSPGEYTIKLKLDGYKDWSQKVPVVKEKATVLDKLLLVPAKRPLKEALGGEIKNFIPISKSGFLLVRGGPNLSDIKVYSYEQEKEWPLLPEGSLLAESKFISLFSEEQSPYILVLVSTGKTKQFLWINLQDSGNTIKDISDLFRGDPEQVEWLPGAENALFVLREGNIDKLDTTAGAVYPQIIRNVRGYGLFNNQIYVLNNSATIMKTAYDAKSSTFLLDDSKLGIKIFGPKEKYQLKVLSEDIILFVGESGKIISNHLPYTFVGEGAEGLAFYEQDEKVLVWTDKKIGVIDFLAEETQNTDFEKGPSMEWVYTEGGNISQAFWVYEGSHILFQDQGEVSLLGLEEFGAKTLEVVRETQKKSDIYFSEDTGKMYFLLQEGKGLFETPIVPSKELIPMSLPKESYDLQEVSENEDSAGKE